MVRDVSRVQLIVNAHNKIHVHLAFQDILMMLFSKTAFSALQLVIQLILAAINAAIKFKAQVLSAHHVLLEIMYFDKEDSA